ncbi:MAG: KipI antagonist [Verrucomicrobiota bacterium]|jgi:KipI family sensor histidine kinase inhibitor
MTLTPLGDSAVVLEIGAALDESALPLVARVTAALRRHAPAVVVEIVPAFGGVAVFYDPARVEDFPAFCAALRTHAAAALRPNAADTTPSEAFRAIEIPVCYEGEFAPDLPALAARAGLPTAAVAGLHTGAEYRVHAIGFTPGFAYLGGLAPALHAPRRATPRTVVPPGSVAIGGALTGVYPLATPGGWHLIGRTPEKMFDATRAEPALLRAGDRVRFRTISLEEFRQRETESHAPPKLSSGETPGNDGAALASRPSVEVRRAGILTTVQDLGRLAQRSAGVPTGGAMGAFALRVANLLVGNAENAAALEFTLRGPELVFSHDVLVAATGADFGALPQWAPVRVRAGEPLRFSAAARGCRGYLAVAGGLAVPLALGSASTLLRAGLGGAEGRALRDGDRLPLHATSRTLHGHWRLDERMLPAYSAAPTLRVVRGVQAEEFGGEIFSDAFRVSPQSDRMGVRLAGATLVRRTPRELPSAVVVPGTVQVPPDGQPIILGADAGTLGGYPQLAHVIAVDLPLVAQLRPGDTVRFREVALAEAHALAHTRERALGLLREGVAQKFR